MNNLRSILNIEFLVKDDALKNWRMILFLSFLAVIMISSGHNADKKIFKIASLNTEIKVLKSEFIEVKKKLLILKKESAVANILSENGVGPASSPPIKIIISNE
jgi:hypothetical protein